MWDPLVPFPGVDGFEDSSQLFTTDFDSHVSSLASTSISVECRSTDYADGMDVSVSTTFYPGSNLVLDQSPPDLLLFSSDSVLFCVHVHSILQGSDNRFNNLIVVGQRSDSSDSAIPPDSVLGSRISAPVIHVPEPSAVLNIILHTIHGISCAHYAPPLATLEVAIRALEKYGVSLQTALASSRIPHAPLYTHLLSHARTSPLELYTFAAEHDLVSVAVATSPFLLSISLSTLSDDNALRIGSLYMKRLFFLHLSRVDALKRLLLPPLQTHPPTPICDLAEQETLGRAWVLGSAYLAWDARPDVSGATIARAFGPLGEHLTCELCKVALSDRVTHLLAHWDTVSTCIQV